MGARDNAHSTPPHRPRRERAPFSACEHQARRECYAAIPYIVSAVISIATTAVSAVQQQKQADAQTEYQQEVVKANNDQTSNQQEALRIQEAQRREALARDANKALMLSRAEQASAETVASSAGVEGASVAALSQSYEASRGRYIESVNRQSAFTASGSSAQIGAVGQQANYTNLSVNAPVGKPNYGAAALKMGGAIASAYGDYRRT